MKINLKHIFSNLTAIIILLTFVSCGNNADNMLKIDGKQYKISIGDIQELAVMTGIKMLGDEIVQKFNDCKNKPVPAWMKIVVNGETIEATGQATADNYVMFVFDGLTKTPDEIIVYNVDDATSQLKFDGKTKKLKK
jgi:hypothetical protein